MPNTPKGLPYPVATDPVAGGAAAIQALASAVDAKLYLTARKTTPKAVANTVVDTDLLNGEVTVGAGVMGIDRICRLTVSGDYENGSGAQVNFPRFKLKLGAAATVVIDTGTCTTAPISSAVGLRGGWRLVIEIANLGSAASQICYMNGGVGIYSTSSSVASLFWPVGRGAYVLRAEAQVGIAHIDGNNIAAINTAVAMPIVLSVVNPTATAFETKLLLAFLEIM